MSEHTDWYVSLALRVILHWEVPAQYPTEAEAEIADRTGRAVCSFSSQLLRRTGLVFIYPSPNSCVQVQDDNNHMIYGRIPNNNHAPR